MFKVVWKSFKYNRKNFLSFFMSEILSVAVIFMLIYIQEALSQVPGIKTEALQFAYQSELRKQLRIIIPCIILIMILVTGYSVKAYINTRIWDYKLFQLLGIRKKNLKVSYLVIDNMDKLDAKSFKLFVELLEDDTSYDNIILGAVNHDDTLEQLKGTGLKIVNL